MIMWVLIITLVGFPNNPLMIGKPMFAPECGSLAREYKQSPKIDVAVCIPVRSGTLV
jgi:hypothetical protein